MKNKKPVTKPPAKEGGKNKKSDKFADPPPDLPKELGGRKGPEPTRYGDWEKDGIVSDF